MSDIRTFIAIPIYSALREAAMAGLNGKQKCVGCLVTKTSISKVFQFNQAHKSCVSALNISLPGGSLSGLFAGLQQ